MPRALARAVILSALGCAAGPSGAASLASCAAMVDDARRLACYDELARGQARTAQAASTAAAEVPQRDAAASPETELERQWELRPSDEPRTFRLRPYRSVYALAHATSNINNAPNSPTREVGLQDVHLQGVEAKLQLSFKSKLLENSFGSAIDLWFGYTQQSHWQAANSRYSSPFRETNYEPEIIALRALDIDLPVLRMRYVAASFTHESNGRGEVLSRSWNRLVGDIAAERGAWSFHLRPWLRLDPAAGARDDNPDIDDFVGRGEVVAEYRNHGHVLTWRGRHSLHGGARSHGSWRLDWAFPLTGKLNGHLQFFTGYGESLIDYNHRQSTLGVGVSFLD